MTQESVTCFDNRGTYAEVRVKSEDSLTTRIRAIWTSGDFLPIARSYARGAEEFITRLGVHRSETVLDVACGTGNLAIPAAKTGARVYGIDIAPYMIAQARLEARAAGASVEFNVGNAESLPFMDRLFDTTVSMFGAMFSPRPQATASELVRVTRDGGRVAMANWTPGGFAGQFFRAHLSVSPLPPNVRNPLDWGHEEKVRALFGDFVSSLTFARRRIELRFPMPPSAVSRLFATSYGPTVAALETLDALAAEDFRDEMSRLFHLHNRATDGTTSVCAEFLDVLVRVE
jgi:ubiquinone/menaquinone biosynthesis C-methylase UbiE